MISDSPRLRMEPLISLTLFSNRFWMHPIINQQKSDSIHPLWSFVPIYCHKCPHMDGKGPWKHWVFNGVAQPFWSHGLEALISATGVLTRSSSKRQVLTLTSPERPSKQAPLISASRLKTPVINKTIILLVPSGGRALIRHVPSPR